MKICLPVMDDLGLESRISSHFGSAPFYLLVDLGSYECRTIPNLARSKGECACDTFHSRILDEASGFIVHAMGRPAWMNLRRQSSPVFKAKERLVKQALDSYLKNQLSEIQMTDMCSHEGEAGHCRAH